MLGVPVAVRADRLPEAAVLPAFTSRGGTRFLAREVSGVLRRRASAPTYSTVSDMLRTAPLIVPGTEPVRRVVHAMSERDVGYCVVTLAEEGRETPGLADQMAWYHGKLYRFAGEKEKRKFLAEPERYAAK